VLTVVIDTEEEFDWSAPFDPNNRSVQNIARQPLAQSIFDRHGLVPTYVIDHPVAASLDARAILRPIHEDGRCEIGAHLHPWVNPPHGESICPHNSFPGNLPADQERAKLETLLDTIEAGFGHRPRQYKAGRYGIGPNSARILADLGLGIDLSVVPFTDFSAGEGPNFSRYSWRPFETERGLVAIPLSAGFAGLAASMGATLYPRVTGPIAKALRLPGQLSRLRILERLRLSPEGHSLNDMIRQTRAGLARGQRLFMMTYHSSSLLPGATPYVHTKKDLDIFINTIDNYIRFFLDDVNGRVSSIQALRDLLVPSEQEGTHT